MAADRTSRKLPKKGISSTLTGSKISLTNGVTPATGTGKKSKCIGWSGILLEEDIEVVLEFAKEHKLEDLCIYLSVLCRFVSELPQAKDDWDESFKHPGSRMGRFEARIKLSDEFLSNLVHVTAKCIHGSSDFEHLKRILWETWLFFNPALDCVYSPRMKAHR